MFYVDYSGDKPAVIAAFNTIIEAVNWAVAKKTAYNIVGVNLSLGGGSSKGAACCLMLIMTAA